MVSRRMPATSCFSRPVLLGARGGRVLAGLLLLVLAGCSVFEDAATSISFQVERNVWLLGRRDGSVRVVVHDARKRAGPDVRVVQAQFDPVGAVIVWYRDKDGNVLESSSTSSIGRHVDIPQRIIVEKPIDSPLRIELRRRDGRVVITRVD